MAKTDGQLKAEAVQRSPPPFSNKRQKETREEEEVERKKVPEILAHKSKHNGLTETKLNYFKLFPSF